MHINARFICIYCVNYMYKRLFRSSLHCAGSICNISEKTLFFLGRREDERNGANKTLSKSHSNSPNRDKYSKTTLTATEDYKRNKTNHDRHTKDILVSNEHHNRSSDSARIGTHDRQRHRSVSWSPSSSMDTSSPNDKRVHNGGGNHSRVEGL